MLFNTDHAEYGATQRRIKNPLRIGDKVKCTLSDVDFLFTDLEADQTGIIIGFWASSYVDVRMKESGRTYKMAIEQVEVIEE